MSSIVKMYDASNNDVYPITHLRAVRDSNGTTLESMIQGVNETTVGYYECNTAGSTPEKAITIDSSVILSVRISCKVKFAEKNTGANATMNINSTGAKPLFYNGVRAAANNSWYTNEIVDLYFDGTNYQAKSCADTLEYDVSLHQTHEITEVTTTTRTVVYNGDVTSGWENETSVSDSSVNGYTRTETNTGKDNDATTVDGPTAKYDTASNKTSVVYVTKRTLTHVVNDYTFDEAVNAVPMSYRHGGLKLRFISNSDGSLQNSDNKYVQYRLMKNTWSTTVSDWQGVDDEPTIGSNNLVESGGVAYSISQLKNSGYFYAGIATPTTNPGTPDGSVFYIANGKGTYTNFGGIDVTEDDAVILYYDTVWHKEATGIASNDKLTELGLILRNDLGLILRNNFELGNITTSTSGWSYGVSSSRVRSKKGVTFHLKVGDVVSLKDYTDARFYIGWRKSDGTYGYRGWFVEGKYVVENEGEYVILLCNKTETTQTSIDALLGLLVVDSGELGKIERKIGQISMDLFGVFDSRFVNGTLDHGTLVDTIKYRVAINNIVSYDRDIVVRIADGFKFAVHTFVNGVYSSDSNWKQRTYTIPAGTEFKCMIARVTENLSEIADIEEFVSKIQFESISSQIRDVKNVEFTNSPLRNGLKGWIRHGNGEWVVSAATTTYKFPANGISKIKAFLKSDTNVIDAVAFYGSDSIDQNTYLQSSVRCLGDYPNGTWYEVEIPSDAKILCVTSDTRSFVPIIQFKVNEYPYLIENELSNINLNKIKGDIVLHGLGDIYHFGMNEVSSRGDVEVPSQSVFDVRYAKLLGYNCIEANVHKTLDGKYVTTHGQNGALGHDFDDLNGNDAYGVMISQKTLSELQTNYRYHTSIDEYRVPITTLEEFCAEAKKQNIIVMVMWSDANVVKIARNILGDNQFFMYNAPRDVYDGAILEYLSYTTKEEIVSRVKSVGLPYIYSMANPTSFTSEQLKDICLTLHEMGAYVASAYVGDGATYKGYGFDFIARMGKAKYLKSNQTIIDSKKVTFNSDGTVVWSIL